MKYIYTKLVNFARVVKKLLLTNITNKRIMSNTSHIKFTMMYRETSDNTFIGRVMEFPEIFIESPDMDTLKDDLKGAINHVILKNKHFSSQYQGMEQEDLELCA